MQVGRHRGRDPLCKYKYELSDGLKQHHYDNSDLEPGFQIEFGCYCLSGLSLSFLLSPPLTLKLNKYVINNGEISRRKTREA